VAHRAAFGELPSTALQSGSQMTKETAIKHPRELWLFLRALGVTVMVAIAPRRPRSNSSKVGFSALALRSPVRQSLFLPQVQARPRAHHPLLNGSSRHYALRQPQSADDVSWRNP